MKRGFKVSINGIKIAFKSCVLRSGGISPVAHLVVADNNFYISKGDVCRCVLDGVVLLQGQVDKVQGASIILSGGDYLLNKVVEASSWQDVSVAEILLSYGVAVSAAPFRLSRFSYGSITLKTLCDRLALNLGCVYYFNCQGQFVLAPQVSDLETVFAHFETAQNIISSKDHSIEAFAQALSCGAIVTVNGAARRVTASATEIKGSTYRVRFETQEVTQ